MLKELGWRLIAYPTADVAVRLTLRLLGAGAVQPSNAEVLRAVRWRCTSPSAEALGVGLRCDVAKYCAGFPLHHQGLGDAFRPN
ncbi:MAG: hypothetical protein QW677_04795 [Pyrobaculum sp.]|uniref:hypothetical protein n=1 Tax=Pyrobaculum TaxID=2276 RepID=UPI0011C07AFE|nr:hypothetical protein [Pyrobaculum aerophilum]